ncbi:hypothetical protein ABFV05_008028 [Capra hircus]
MPVSGTPDSRRGRNFSSWGEVRRGRPSSSARPAAALNPNPPLALGPPASSSLLVARLPSKTESWNRQVGESGTGKGSPHRPALFARSPAGDLFAKWRWSRGDQCWNEAAPPAPTLPARGPDRGRGDTPGRRGRFSKPSYRKPRGSPAGDQLPTARNPLSGAGCEAGREKTREIHATCMQLEEEENPSEPCALPGDAFTVSLQSACLGVQPASPSAPSDRSAPAAAPAAAAAAGSRRGTRAEGERERTARERREGRKRVITRGRRGPARLGFGRRAARHRAWAGTGSTGHLLGL